MTQIPSLHQHRRLDEVVKIVTMITTIFIPLSFITGLYGMNFHHIPGLDWRYSFEVIVLLMVILSIIMLIYFKKKRWLGKAS